jgi:hypothetical protein
MESEMQILAYVGGALLLLVIYTVWGMIRMQTPTRGRAIDSDRRPGEALVVIDVQKDFTSPATYDPISVEQALSRINALAADARDSGIPVLNVRHVFKGPYVNLLVRLLSGGRGAAGSPGLGTDPRLQLGASAEFLKHRGRCLLQSAVRRMAGPAGHRQADHCRPGRKRLRQIHCRWSPEPWLSR